MPENRNPAMIYRCPVCFARENDVYMFREGDTLYCMKCSFSGTEERVQELYADLRKKYGWIQRRLTLEEQRAL